MATVDRNENEENNITLPIPSCEWCRMGLHKKCEKLSGKIHAFCVCDCERGY